jgi:hypothetical protein
MLGIGPLKLYLANYPTRGLMDDPTGLLPQSKIIHQIDLKNWSDNKCTNRNLPCRNNL